MKKVVFESTKTVNACEITNELIVGIHWNNGSKSTFLPCFGANRKIVGYYASTEVAEDISSKIIKESVREYVKNCDIHQGVYVFETSKELYKWLSK